LLNAKSLLKPTALSLHISVMLPMGLTDSLRDLKVVEVVVGVVVTFVQHCSFMQPRPKQGDNAEASLTSQLVGQTNEDAHVFKGVVVVVGVVVVEVVVVVVVVVLVVVVVVVVVVDGWHRLPLE